MPEYQASAVIDGALLDVAYDLVVSSRRFSSKRREGRLAKSRSCALGVLVMATCALEAAVNFHAGAYYDDGPGRAEAQEAGWPGKWYGPRGYSLARKWKDFAPLLGGEHFAKSAFTGWQAELRAMIRCRNELVVHFKGRWAEPDAQAAFASLSASDAERWFQLARHLINTLHSGYMHTHRASAIRDIPHTLYPKGPMHPVIPPISQGTAGTLAVGFVYPFEQLKTKDPGAVDS